MFSMCEYKDLLKYGLKNQFVPSIFGYDEVGSRLFEERRNQPEYYLYNLEDNFIKNNTKIILSHKKNDHFFDLGCGRTEKLYPVIKNYKIYTAIDVDRNSCIESSQNVEKNLKIESNFLNKDYFNCHAEQTDLFFMGSNISNLLDFQIKELFSRYSGGHNTIFVTADLEKNINTMVAAYNDKNKVGEKMEKNTLKNINNLFGTSFDVDQMSYHVFWDNDNKIVSTDLVFDKDYEFFIDNVYFKFKKNDSIRIGYLRKLSLEDWVVKLNIFGNVVGKYEYNGFGLFVIEL